MSGRQALEKLFRRLQEPRSNGMSDAILAVATLPVIMRLIRHLPIATAGMGNRACRFRRETGGFKGNIQI